MTKKMKFRLFAFFYDTKSDADITYTKEIEIKTENHVDFINRFLQVIADRGIVRSLNNQYGTHSFDTDINDKYWIIEEFGIYDEISEEDFKSLWKKWKAVLKQEGLI